MAENRLRYTHFNSLNTFLLCISSISGTAQGSGDIAINETDYSPILLGLHYSTIVEET